MIITIVGGGIAGIYLAHKLLLEHGDEWAGQIVLVEGNRLGGRVQTIKKRGHGTVSQFEAGAARFFSNHHSLVNLMNKLGFTKKKDWIPLKIPTTFRMLDDKGDLVTDKWVKQSMEKAIEILKNNDLTGQIGRAHV